MGALQGLGQPLAAVLNRPQPSAGAGDGAGIARAQEEGSRPPGPLENLGVLRAHHPEANDGGIFPGALGLCR